MNTNAMAKQYQLKQWEQTISECRSSGISVKEWCKQNNLTKANYYYRLRRVREAMLMITEQTQIVEVPQDIYTPKISTTLHAPANQGLSIVIGNATVCVESDTPAELLSTVLGVMNYAK